MQRRLLVDLEALTANYRDYLEAGGSDKTAGKAVGAVVKADGYGTGATGAANRLAAEGCRDFFVASAEEALALAAELFVQSPTCRIFQFEGPQADNVSELAAAGIVPVLNHSDQLDCWRPHADLPAAVQVDSGLTRLGFPVDVDAAMFEGFNIALLLTHLACADEPDHPLNERQAVRFAETCGRFPGVRTSFGNSAGWLDGRWQGDLGRVGIGLYGGNPFSDRSNPLQPVASLQGRVLQIKEISPGESVGYGATYVADDARRVAIVGIGYADGVPRSLSNRGEMAVAGHRCPVLGRVSMDVTAIDVTDQPAVIAGDWVECFGASISVDEVASWAGTIAYEVLTGVGSRVPRCYQALSD